MSIKSLKQTSNVKTKINFPKWYQKYTQDISLTNVPMFLFRVCVCCEGVRGGGRGVDGVAGNCKTLIIDNLPLYCLCFMFTLLYVVQGN